MTLTVASAGAPPRPALSPFFAPHTVAVIGASRDPSKVGGSVLANLVAGRFPGRVVAVNAAAATVQGLRAAPSVLAIDGPVDLAVIAVPAAAVLPVLEACAAKGVGGAVVISAGFREIGAEGRAREDTLRAWLAHAPLRVIGPNCLGWIRPSGRLNVTFAPGMPSAGGIAFVSHSGALAVAILDWSRGHHLGFSVFASLGNQADVTETDVLDAVVADGETRVIVMYLEGVADGRRFFEALRAAAAVKPVVLLKAGRSAEGARAVSSHTGALAGSDDAFDAAVRQAGALRARTIEELFDLARGLASQPLPRGRRLLVVTNGGGLGIVATDAARAAGLGVAPLDEATRARLRAALPPTASVTNPVDIIGDADPGRMSRALHALGTEPAADAALICLTAQATTDSAAMARAIIAATREWPIPVATAFVGGARLAPGTAAVEDASIPCYAFPERAVGALAGMATLAERRRATAPPPRPSDGPPPDVVAAVAALRAAGRRQLGLLDLAPILRAYGIPTARIERAATPAEAASVAENIGLPVALKVVSPDVTHKTDVGGVRLGLRSPGDVADAATAMLVRVRAARRDARIEGLLVQAMAKPGTELLLGALRDAQFGPLVIVGFGGIHVEVLKDTTARLAPVAPDDAGAMLGELRMAPLLAGVRGERPADRAALVDVITR
ncbi:MAG: acetate--CoA ligase family protein, partial [Candidatus Rokubacteria bacterium]|nr:acetate--CoA ligase family protein [Candidatus Rokubacteria bacterium]